MLKSMRFNRDVNTNHSRAETLHNSLIDPILKILYFFAQKNT